MPYLSDLYSTLANRLSDWMTDAKDTGGNVTSRVLDLINRAQDRLWFERKWSGLVKRAALTLSSGRTYTLPSDCGIILRVYHDTDSDGRPDWDYYEDSPDTARGYYVNASFAKATGWTRTITFLASPTHSPYVKYYAKLADFAGTGTEYLFFPANLMLATAQLIHLEEGGLSADDAYKALSGYWQREIVNYAQLTQYENPEQRMIGLDDEGTQIENDRYSLSEGQDSEPTPFDPSYDGRY